MKNEHKKRLKDWKKRKLQIVKLREKGWTFEKIGKKYGTTRQNVHRIFMNSFCEK